MATLDDIREKLKAGQSKPASKPTAKASPANDAALEAIRARIKGAAPRPKDALLPSESSGSLRLARLEAAVNAIAVTLGTSQLQAVKTAVSQAQ